MGTDLLLGVHSQLAAGAVQLARQAVVVEPQPEPERLAHAVSRQRDVLADGQRVHAHGRLVSAGGQRRQQRVAHQLGDV